MNENKRKTFGTIFGIILFICCILFVTYAWYVWRSEYININANIAEETSDVNFSPDTMEVNASDIGPILDYTDSDYYTEANKGKYLAYADFSAENKSSDTFYINAILEITSISDSLKVDSFKYVLLRKNTSNGVYSQIISEGDFSNFIVGNNTILLTEIGSKDTYYYRFVVYIDGTMNNSNDMMNGSLKSFLQLSASKNPVNVTFDVNSGSNWTSSTCTFYLDGTTCSKSVVKDETYGEMPIPVKTGYNFDGWYTSASGGNKVNETTVVTSTTDHILYAHWTANTYNISYSLNNGLSGSNAPKSATYDASVNISNPTKSISIVGNANSTGASVGSNTSASYTFSGWTASNLNTSTAKYGTSSSNITTSWNNASTKVTAQYFKNLTSTANATVTLTANWTKPSTVTLPTLSKTGYTCNWYDNSSGTGTAYKSGGTYTLTSSDDGLTSKTFYANCVSSAESYAVTFNVNSGNNWTSSTCSTSDGFSLSGTTCSKTVTSDSTYGDLPTPVRSSSGSTYLTTNYVFDGWYDASSGGNQILSSSLVEITSDVQLYAHWLSYYSYSNYSTITFDVNNGNAWTSDTCKTGDGFLFNSSTSACTKAISSSTATTVNAFPTPTRSGYVFSGWYSATSGGTEYVVPYTTTRTNYTYASLTMYAQWEAGTMVSALSLEDDSTYTITYDANGGDATSVPEPQTKTYGVNLTLSTTVPTYSGYTFLGWSTDSKATSATYEPGGIYSSNADATLYAVWQND